MKTFRQFLCATVYAVIAFYLDNKPELEKYLERQKKRPREFATISASELTRQRFVRSSEPNDQSRRIFRHLLSRNPGGNHLTGLVLIAVTGEATA